jgi:transcriptional regulator with XRE-family HTH domain
MTESISENIKTLREKRGWTQHQLADRLGVEQSTISRWEAGTTKPVGLYLRSVMRLLGARRGVA